MRHPTPWLTTDLSDAARGWLSTLRDDTAPHHPLRWKYNRHMLRPWAVEGTAHAVMIRHLLGDQPDAPWTQGIPGVVAQIQSWQDRTTGLFTDPLIKPTDRKGDHHTWEHIWNHVTQMCIDALELLDAQPLHPLPAHAFRQLTPGTVRPIVLAMEWSNPWLVGEHWSAMIRSHRRSKSIRCKETDAAIDEAVVVVEQEILDPATGLPTRRGCTTPAVAVCGLFKILFAYEELQRPFPHPERAIDSVLDLQEDNGGFRDNMCINWDAADVVRRMTKQLDGAYRMDDIIAMGDKLAAHLLVENRKPDGAFSFFRANCIPVHNSIRVSDPLPESDVVGTYMALECLRYVDEWRAMQMENLTADGRR